MKPNDCQPAAAAQLQTVLEEALQPLKLEIIDESNQHKGHAGANALGYGSHIRVRIAASIFTGKSRLACHRLVYDALHPFMHTGLHALAIEIINN